MMEVITLQRIQIFMNVNFKSSLYDDVVKARSYYLLLEHIVKNNKHDIICEISFHSLIDSLITTICRMYDKNSKIGNLYKELKRENENFKCINHANYDCELFVELKKLVNSEDYEKLKKWRDKCIAHKDNNLKENILELKESKLLNLVDPYIVFAEKIYDNNSIGERGEVIDKIKRRLNEE